MAYTIDTSLASAPQNSSVTLLSLGTQASNGKVTSNTLRFGTNNANTITFGDGSGVYHGSTAGVAASPYGEAGNYLAAEPATLGGGVSFNYATAQKYFGLLWGSVDSGNTITFYNGLVQVGVITGSTVSSSPNGSQGADGSYFVNINFTDTSFTRVVFSTPSPAFEFNAIAYSASTVPTTPNQTGTPTVTTATDSGTGKVVGYDSAPATLGGTVFLDANADGLAAASDAAVSGVTVRLMNSAGAVVSTDVTDSTGAYKFNNVAAGNYTVTVVAPSGDRFSPTAAAATGSKVDSGGLASVSVTAGSSNTINAGVYVPASISGTAFVDANGNGVQDSGDTLLAGATVQLLNSAGTAITTTTTASNGTYSFTGVTPGDYVVAFTAPSGRVFTARDQGTNDAIDSDVGTNGRTGTITLASGGSASNVSAGVYTPVSISGVAFQDRNADGLQGTGDTLLAGVAVQLLDASGAVVASTTTATNGAYSFTSVAPGTYQVSFTAPGGTVFTLRDQGTNDAIDSDVGSNGRSGSITLASGGSAANVSAGVYTPATISGVAFTDNNADGVQSSSDAVLAGVAVQLLDASGTAVASTTTSATGAYSFSGVRPGTYQVAFTAPGGTVFTLRDQGTNDAIDSDVGTDGRSASLVLASGDSIANLSAGVYTPASISGVAFTDTNADGVQGAGDAVLAGVAVRLLDAGGAVVATTTTAANGAYSFNGLKPGTYEVGFAAPAGTVFTARDQGNNDATDSDVSSAGLSGSLTLTSGASIGNLSAGIYTPATISGTAFTDNNADGVQGAGDTVLAGTTVQLLDASGAVVATTTTSAAGAYSFTAIRPGTYQVAFTAPNGTVFTLRDQGTNDAIDSDVGANGRSAAITLASGGSATNISAGVYTPVSISGVAFLDSNGNGIQNTTDTLLTGVAVQLLDANGGVVGSTTTSATGTYSFTGVAPGTYQVAFTAPDGTVFTARDQGGNDAIDSDVGSNGRSATFTLTSGGSAANVSAGVYAPVSISGTAFVDRNADGVQGPSDTVLAGVPVQLLDASGTVVANATTSATGAYSFTGVAPGTYQVAFTAPSGTVFTLRDQGTNDTIDSDVGANGRSGAITLASGGSATNVSAGVYAPVSISGTAFVDGNGNGLQDPGDAVLSGTTVQLLDAGGAVVASTTTSSTGAYNFAGVAPGTYQVGFTAPAGTVFTARDQGTNDAIDSDVGTNGRTGTITLASGGSASNVSAGVYTPVSISGVAFQDRNADGLQGTGDTLLAGVAVQLLDAGGAVVASTTTATNGAYSFTSVAPGTYQVSFTAPDGTVFTLRDQGTNDAIDSDVGANGRSGNLTLASGGTATNVSAGVYTPTGISGVAFLDSNADGLQGPGDTLLAGVAVQLLNGSGAVVSSTTTSSTGAYTFAGVGPGSYQVAFTAPDGTVFTLRDQGTNDAIDSDVGANGRSGTITLASGDSAANVSAGVYAPVSVGGVAFIDNNGNGIQDAGDGLAAGVAVQLLNGSGAVVGSTTTSSTGAYSFAGVAPGTYQVAFTGPAGTVFTARDQGTNDSIDSDVGTNGRSGSVVLSSGGSSGAVSAGFYTPAAISGVAFTDSNGNGIQDTGDAVSAGVTVRLTDANGAVLGTTTTSATGAYNFAGLAPGAYRVAFTAPNGTVFTARDQGSNDSIDSDVGADGRSSVINLQSGASVGNVSAGVYTPVTIGGVAFTDNNADGVQGTGDAVLAGVAVRLLDGTGGIVASTTTAANGAYSFAGVAPGTYKVAFTAPDGTVFTLRDQGSNDAIDSDVGSDGRSALFTLPSGGSSANLSAGVYTPASISGTAFVDSNGNGVQDAGDAVLAGTTVQLLNGSGAVVGTTTTAANGTYSFAGLQPGRYEVAFTAPAGAIFTGRDQGNNDSLDSDVGANGRSGLITLASGSSVGNLSAGVYTPGRVSGIAFTDTNADGIRNGDEPVLAGVAVRLLDSNGAVVASTTTAANGTYSFGSIVPGTYQVAFTAPRGTAFTARDQGTNDAVDSDVGGNGESAPFTLVSGGSVSDLSAGVFTPGLAQLGGYAWMDANGDGIHGSDEVALQGVMVRLLDASGKALGPVTTTDASGFFSFTGLSAGSYRAGFAPLLGSTFTLADRGGNEALDSDVTGANGVSSLLVQLGNGTVDNRSTVGLVIDLRQSPSYAPSVNLGDGDNNFSSGTDSPAVVHGNGGNDILQGRGGNDTLYGDAGNDFINGHEGNDGLNGGDGDDNVQGQEGDDLILGGAGNDIGEGGLGNDVLLGGPGNDNMQGELGDDMLFGGTGDDIMVGNEGNDLLAGGAGNDSLPGGPGNDVVIGGRDNGRLVLNAAGQLGGFVVGDLIEGNEGADAFVYQAGDGVDLMLDFNPAEGDTLTIYGHTAFSAIGRLPDGRMALYLGPNSGFVINNDIFRDIPAGSPLPGIRFVQSLADAPGDIVGGDMVIPILARNWLSKFQGLGPITVSQDFPALDQTVSPQDLTNVTFDNYLQLSSTNDSVTLPAGNNWVDAGSGYDVITAPGGFRGVGHALLPGGLRLDIGSSTDLITGGEEVRFADGTLFLSPDSNAAQVFRLYDAALGRTPDQGGLNTWIAQLDSGAPLINLADAFLGSAEFGQRYGNLSNQDYVTLLYRNVLDRAPDEGGYALWNSVLAAGASRAQVLLSFSESAENKAAQLPTTSAGIWDLSETAAQIARLYDTALGRLPDVAGLSFWRGNIESGGFTLNGVAEAFVNSAEFQAQYGSLSNRAFVELVYQNALDRNGDAAGIDFWTNNLDSGAFSRSGVVLGFSESVEHQALTAPNIVSEDPGRFGILFTS
ncbi:SdrD B-like domain-containing protein [Roseomonas haemaphysalidis]|uniref:Carboxypeptidase regulatory-like domain-containing protein n=1 Tax=Roseomonas haemaphysalidis TaxID=2768162 RepID=A0ABS3KKA5_9PROT|nr:SdrD B-like domain-containing protein [Roseomonas haemaphysalidis]MBO1077911.1 carboxypeptidase regulatory-like domain-containing protein [Roseomonas haemaphysalidis]